MKNNHLSRIIVASLILLVVLLSIFLLLPKTPLVIAAFCFAVFGPILVGGTFWQLANGNRSSYITLASFPFQTIAYCGLNFAVDAVAVILALTQVYTLPVGWFCVIHILILAFYGLRIVIMSAGHEAVVHAGQQVQAATWEWKLILADTEALFNAAPADLHDTLSGLKDAIRFADPVTLPELREDQQAIAEGVSKLKASIGEATEEQVKTATAKLLLDIQNRNHKLKLLK